NVIHRPGQLVYNKLGVSRGIFAPSLSYAKGVFYVVCTMADAGGNFVVTATNPSGPWSNPTWLDFEGIDPSIFFDDDGRAWMVNNGAPVGTPLYSGHRAIWLQEFDPVNKKMIGPRTVLVNGGVDITKKPVWIEGPHLYKKDGWYFLCCAEGGTGPNHSQVVLRSRKIGGPYQAWAQNPILTQRDLDPSAPFAVTSTGHANLVLGPDNRWWSVFLGIRPYDRGYSPMGRETFLLPVTWPTEGWPQILAKGKRVPLVVNTPEHSQVDRTAADRLNGNFTWKASFDSTELPVSWLMLRTPRETWWQIDPKQHCLWVTAQPEKLSGNGNPSYLARRIQHSNFVATVSVEPPVEPNVSAGLALFQGERFHYFLAVSKRADGLIIYIEQARDSEPKTLRSVQLPLTTKLELRATVHDASGEFSYRATNGSWQTLLTNADAKLLTTEVAGGFVGATIGLHVRLDQ
ncbi:MAG TPA: glycoside hydrolase family 43 protein, partial [Opitutaceae bacterium]